MSSQASDEVLPVLSGTCGAMLSFFVRSPLTYFEIHSTDTNRNAFDAVWKGITDAQKRMLSGLLESLMGRAADPEGRKNILELFRSALIYHDNSQEHSSNVSKLLAILIALPLDAVRAMLLLTGTQMIFIREGGDALSAVTESTYESAREVAHFPFGG